MIKHTPITQNIYDKHYGMEKVDYHHIKAEKQERCIYCPYLYLKVESKCTTTILNSSRPIKNCFISMEPLCDRYFDLFHASQLWQWHTPILCDITCVIPSSNKDKKMKYKLQTMTHIQNDKKISTKKSLNIVTTFVYFVVLYVK